jgi:hypothetical protein
MSSQTRRRLPLFLLSLYMAHGAVAQVQLTPGTGKIDISIGGKPYSTFYMAGPGVTKPYLWPVRAASGTYVTRAFPMETVPEEEKDRKNDQHQRGMWFTLGNVNGLDFWNNEASYPEPPKRGEIVLKTVGEVKSGKDKGSLSAVFNWTDRQGNVLLTEARTMTFHAEPNLRIIDLDITLTSVQKVVWGDSKDGAFGIRLRPALAEAGGSGSIMNAEGLIGEKQVWGKPSNWCDYSGAIGEEKVGVTMLSHPRNSGHPARFHVRGTGLLAANPFGLSAFTNDPSQDGAQTVEAGHSLHFRYRVIVHAGDTKSIDIPALYAKFAAEK